LELSFLIFLVPLDVVFMLDTSASLQLF